MEIQIFRKFDHFRSWAEERARALAMEAHTVSIPELEPDWEVSEGVLRRPDGRFFTVRGVQVTHAAGREVSGWGQPMVCDDDSGFVAIITRRSGVLVNREPVLVRMKGEPGNRGMFVEVDGKPFNTRVLVCPPVQFSQGNLDNHRRALKGELDPKGKPYKRVPFASLALKDALPAWAVIAPWQDAAEDGGRFFEKINRYGHVPAFGDREDQLASEIEATGQGEDFAWISRDILRNIFRLTLRSRNCLANFHLRSVCSLLV